MTDYHLIGPQKLLRINSIIEQAGPQSGDARKPRAGQPLPTMARATADVAKYTQHDFQLLKNQPGGLQDGVGTRTAFALEDIKNNDDVVLTKQGGEASRGYWAARVAGKAGQDDKGCCCDLLALVHRHVELTNHLQSDYVPGQTMEERIAELSAKHGCAVQCGGIDIPAAVNIALGTLTDTTSGGPGTLEIKLSQLSGQSYNMSDVVPNPAPPLPSQFCNFTSHQGYTALACELFDPFVGGGTSYNMQAVADSQWPYLSWNHSNADPAQHTWELGINLQTTDRPQPFTCLLRFDVFPIAGNALLGVHSINANQPPPKAVVGNVTIS